MFYCNDCAKKYEYPESFSKSGGKCELCGESKVCNDVPSRELAKPKKRVGVTGMVLNYNQAFDNPMLGVDMGSGDDFTIETEVRKVGGSFLIGKSVRK